MGRMGTFRARRFTQMKSLLVHYEDYPWDVRIEKFLAVLADCCDEVHLVARNRLRRPLIEQTGRVTYHRLRPLSVNGRWGEILSNPAFLNPRWFRRIGEVASTVVPDFIIVRDLPLVLAARHWATRLGCPLIFDMAEDYPAMFSAYRPWETAGERLLNLVLRNEYLARMVELASVKAADHILVVAEEQRDRLHRLGVPLEKITLVRNTPLLERYTPKTSESSSMAVIYVGELHHMRGLDCAIRAMGRLARSGVPATLRLLGVGKTEAALRELAAREAPENVIFEGWVAPERVPEELRNSDIGLVPHQRNTFTSTTIPNKLFDYMASAIPVVTSDAEPLKRVVTEADCGISFPSEDDAALAEALLVLRSPDLRRRLGENGRRAVEQRYNWSADAENLRAAVLQSVVSRPSRQS